LYQEYAYKNYSVLPNSRPRCPQSASAVPPLKIVFFAQVGLALNERGSNFIKFYPVHVLYVDDIF
jgi:hypothetical protein